MKPEDCDHEHLVKVVDKLGPMLDAPVVTMRRGRTVITPGAQAKLLAWHYVCRDCGIALPTVWTS
jgi:hypothetical protein